MKVVPYEITFAVAIAELLNDFLPFEPESADTVEQAGGVRFVCVTHEGKVVGYIAGYETQDFSTDFPYFQSRLKGIECATKQGVTYYTSHFVVHPAYRKQGIGAKLVAAYMQKVEQLAQSIVVVGWVQSDSGNWAAERQFMQHGFKKERYIERYFEPYEVYCPSCEGLCYCDATIIMKQL